MSDTPALAYLNVIAKRGFARAGVSLPPGGVLMQIKTDATNVSFIRAHLGWSAFALVEIAEHDLGKATKDMASGALAKHLADAKAANAEATRLRDELRQLRVNVQALRDDPIALLAAATPAALAALAAHGVDVQSLQRAAQQLTAPQADIDRPTESIEDLAPIHAVLIKRRLKSAAAILAASDDALLVKADGKTWSPDDVRAAAAAAIEAETLTQARTAAMKDLQAVDGIGKVNAAVLYDTHGIDSRHKLQHVLRNPADRKTLADADDLKASDEEMGRWLAQLDQQLDGARA